MDQLLEDPDLATSSPHVMQVHAGLAPDLPLDSQDLWAMYKMRNLAPASDAVASAAEPEGKTRAVSKK